MLIKLLKDYIILLGVTYGRAIAMCFGSGAGYTQDKDQLKMHYIKFSSVPVTILTPQQQHINLFCFYFIVFTLSTLCIALLKY